MLTKQRRAEFTQDLIKCLSKKDCSPICSRSWNQELKIRLCNTLNNAISSAGSEEDLAAIKTTTLILTDNVQGADNAERFASTFKDADPSLFFPFARSSVNLRIGRGRTKKAVHILKGLCPHREDGIKAIFTSFLQQALGDTSRRYPLLVGEPGTAKSHFGYVLAETLKRIGVKSDFIKIDMTTAANDKTNSATDIKHKLLGSDRHWGNAGFGQMYAYTCRKDIELLVVLLDEVEKGRTVYDFLVSVLDPEQPLSDEFVSGFIKHDMRRKAFFILTANDLEPIKTNVALMDRIKTISFSEYSPEQKRDLVISLGIMKGTPQKYGISPDEFQKIAENVLNASDITNLSLRGLNACIGEAVCHARYPDLQYDMKELEKVRKNKIGFI